LVEQLAGLPGQDLGSSINVKTLWTRSTRHF